jgi:hypothetical protein
LALLLVTVVFDSTNTDPSVLAIAPPWAVALPVESEFPPMVEWRKVTLASAEAMDPAPRAFPVVALTELLVRCKFNGACMLAKSHQDEVILGQCGNGIPGFGDERTAFLEQNICTT